MLAHTYKSQRIDWSQGAWLQPKLNGIRALAQNGMFQSRDELPWLPTILSHLTPWLRDMFPLDWVLDGELYVHGWRLQDINRHVAVNRGQPTNETYKVEYHIFDRVSYQLPFSERFYYPMEGKRGLFSPDNPVKIVQTTRVFDPSFADDFYAQQVSNGYEGIMYRLGNCPYTRPKEPGGNGRSKFLSDKNNRVHHMLKRKDWQDKEFPCIRVDEGLGKRLGKAGALICTTPEGREFGVGSGLTDREAEHYLDNPPIGRMVKVKFLCYTSDGIPFNPTVEAVL